MRKRKPSKAWTADRLARVGKKLGTVYGEIEKEALQEAYRASASLARLRSRFEGLPMEL